MTKLAPLGECQPLELFFEKYYTKNTYYIHILYMQTTQYTPKNQISLSIFNLISCLDSSTKTRNTEASYIFYVQLWRSITIISIYIAEINH